MEYKPEISDLVSEFMLDVILIVGKLGGGKAKSGIIVIGVLRLVVVNDVSFNVVWDFAICLVENLGYVLLLDFGNYVGLRIMDGYLVGVATVVL